MMIMDWLRRTRDRFRSPAPPQPPKPAESPALAKPYVDLRDKLDKLSAAERDAIVTGHLNEHLGPLGLIQVAPRRWVDGSAPPVGRLFEMALLKGAAMKAN